METLIDAKGMSKTYGKQRVVNQVNLQVGRGQIVGLVGPNGAGKTTLLKCLLGLAPCDGELQVLGLNPNRQRAQLMEQVCFIADTAILPRWLKAGQAVNFMAAVHPRFRPEKAQQFLAQTNIDPKKRIGKLSKGMITQLHLALVMAIDVPLMVLDEPTLGLDIVYRKQFYTNLLNDYFDQQRTVIITTHQVEEIENLLTDLAFIRQGEIMLNMSMDSVADHFTQVTVGPDKVDAARALQPIYSEAGLGRTTFVFENVAREELTTLGELRTPSVADLFVAKMQQETARAA